MKINIYTDGAARGNPNGPGGYGIIVRIMDKDGNIKESEYSAGFPKTTNNRMELLGVITALESIKNMEACEVIVTTDSQYVVNAINKGWLKNWVSNGWKSSSGFVKNIDLWQRLLSIHSPHEITFKWVKGHASNEFNIRCDKLATEAADKMKGVKSNEQS